MPVPRNRLFRLLASTAVVAICSGTAVAAVSTTLPAQGVPAPGVRVDGETIPAGAGLKAYLDQRAARLESRRVRLILSDTAPPLSFTLRELGLHVDLATVERRVLAVGHTGSWGQRLSDTLRARDGRVDVPLSWTISPAPLTSLLEQRKEDLDRLGVPARFDFEHNTIVPHTDGAFLDVYAALQSLDELSRSGGDSLRVSFASIPPVASEQLLRQLDMSQVVGHFETRFGYLGGQADRAHNIATAAARLDGVVVLPSQVLSFNRLVGHRTIENGFKKGWEIFKGEMVQGVGGGTCQVASTLHAAAYLAGFDIVERSPHSRPSAYIPLGLDATVVDGLVDLKLRNPFAFPVVLHSVVKDGSITFELRGQHRPSQVSFRGDVVDVQRYKRKVTEVSWLAEGRVLRKQRGIRGYRVRKTRTIVLRDGSRRDDVTTDFYPPTVEILLVPPNTDSSTLPPLPFDDASDSRESSPADEEHACTSGCTPALVEDTPEASHGVAPHVPRETVIQR